MVEVNYVPTDAHGSPIAQEDNWFLRKKPGANGLTFLTPGGEISLYGQLDVSIDDTTKGIADKIGPGGPTDRPIGNVGWMPAMSTNLSYVGVRGAQKVDDEWKFIYQLETQIDVPRPPAPSSRTATRATWSRVRSRRATATSVSLRRSGARSWPARPTRPTRTQLQ